MSQDNKTFFCFLICLSAFVVSLLGLMVNCFDVSKMKEENEAVVETFNYEKNLLENEVFEQNKKIEEQNRKIELYKGEIEDTTRCIINGNW